MAGARALDEDHRYSVYTPDSTLPWFYAEVLFERMITPMFDVREGAIHPNGRPRLGIELDMGEVDRYRIDPTTRRRFPSGGGPGAEAAAIHSGRYAVMFTEMTNGDSSS